MPAPPRAVEQHLTSPVLLSALVDSHSRRPEQQRRAGARSGSVGYLGPDPARAARHRAYDATERLLEWIRLDGVTTLDTGHGPGALISGQTMIVKARGRNVEKGTMVPARMLAATLGNAVSSNFESPGRSAKGVAMLREALFGAQAYNERMRSTAADGAGGESPPARDLTKEELGRVLEGELSLLATADSATEIAAALRPQRQFVFDLVLDSAAESYLLLEEIRAAGVPVLVHPPDEPCAQRVVRDPARLAEAGIPFAIQTGFGRLCTQDARAAVRGRHRPRQRPRPREGRLEAVTLGAARILGVDDRVGSIEVG